MMLHPMHEVRRFMTSTALFLIWSMCFGFAAAHARGIVDLKSDFPIALSVQIDPATVTDTDLLRIRAAGFEFVRFGVRPALRDVNPALVDYSKVLGRVRSAGLRAIVTVFGGRGIWGEQPVSNTPSSGEAQFAEFALRWMKAHVGEVAIWEIWNEPDNNTFLDKREFERFDSTVNKLCAVISAMRPAPPIVMGFGFAKMPLISDAVPSSLQDTAVSAARTGCITDLSVHPYRSLPETAIRSFGELRQRLSSLDLPAGVVVSEWGYATYQPVRNSHDQAILLVREYLVSIAADIPLLNIYAWKDRGTSIFRKEDNFGIVSFSGRPKEAYIALLKLLQTLKYTRKLSFEATSDWNRLEFDSKAALIHIVWTEGVAREVRIAVSRNAVCERLSFVNESGWASCGKHEDGFITVTVGAEPIAYVVKK